MPITLSVVVVMTCLSQYTNRLSEYRLVDSVLPISSAYKYLASAYRPISSAYRCYFECILPISSAYRYLASAYRPFCVHRGHF